MQNTYSWSHKPPLVWLKAWRILLRQRTGILRDVFGDYICIFFYWQSLSFFLIHPNLPGPPTVIWMTEPHVGASCRMPDRDNSALHSPWWKLPFLKQGKFKKKRKKTPLSLESFILVSLWLLPPLCVWGFSFTGNFKKAAQSNYGTEEAATNWNLQMESL